MLRIDLGGDQPSAIAYNPLPTPPATFGERFEAEWENSRLTGGTGAAARSLHEEYERQRETLRQAGFGQAPNPVDYDATALGGLVRSTAGREVASRDYIKAVEQARASYPERAGEFLMPDEVQAAADRRALGARRTAETMGRVGGGGAGGFAAQAGAALIDPANVLSMPLGVQAAAGGAALRILRTALVEGGIGFGAQVLSDLGPEGGAWERRRLGLPMDVGTNALEAAVGGAVLGGGIRGLVEGFRLLRGRVPAPDGGVALRENDAALTLERQQRDLGGNPAELEQADLHLGTLDQATEAVAAGRLADLPPVPGPAAGPRMPTGGIQRVLPEENLARGRAAAARVLDGEAQVPGAMYREDVGEITFDAGATGDPERQFRRGSGLSHIAAKRTAEDGIDGNAWVRERMPEVLANGTLQRMYGPPGGRRADILLDGDQVTLSLSRRGRRETWVVTGFERRDGGPGGTGGVNPTRPYAPAPSGIRAAEGAGPRPANVGAGNVRVHTPAGRAVTVEPQLVELRDLIPSHTDDFTPNPAYPHAEGVQPRERGRDASAAQIRDIAANLEPERLGTSPEAGQGAPIIDAENVVESGNGRVLALRQVYGDASLTGRAEAYRAWLASQGFDVAGMENPVLVSRRVSALSPDERRAFVQEANSGTALTLGAAERARLDADLAGRALDLYRGGDVVSAENAGFVRAFMQGVPAAERGALMSAGGGLSGEGARRVRGAVLARAYGDEMGPLLDRILEGEADGLRSIAGALQDAAGPWAAMRAAAARGELAPGMDVTADLLAAVRTVSLAREKRIPVADLLAQTDLDAPPLSDAGRALLASMYRDPAYRAAAGREAVATRLRGYVDEAMKSEPTPDMFGTPPARPSEVLAATDPMRGRQAAAVEAGDRMGAMQAEPKAPDAEFLEAQRVALARGDGAMTIDPMTGEPRNLRELLDEVEQDVADAAGIAACFIGAAA